MTQFAPYLQVGRKPELLRPTCALSFDVGISIFHFRRAFSGMCGSGENYLESVMAAETEAAAVLSVLAASDIVLTF